MVLPAKLATRTLSAEAKKLDQMVRKDIHDWAVQVAKYERLSKQLGPGQVMEKPLSEDEQILNIIQKLGKRVNKKAAKLAPDLGITEGLVKKMLVS